MFDLLSRLAPSDLTAVLAMIIIIGGVLLGVVVGTSVEGFRRYRERQLAISLILELLDRGMSADEVVRVLAAAGLEEHQEKLTSLRQRLRQKLARLCGEPVPPSPKP